MHQFRSLETKCVCLLAAVAGNRSVQFVQSMPSGGDRRRPGIATINTPRLTLVYEETILPGSGEKNEMVNCKDVPDIEIVVGAGERSLYLLAVQQKPVYCPIKILPATRRPVDIRCCIHI